MEDSPAAAAGLEPGDVIVAVNGQPVSDLESLIEMITTQQPGDALTLTVLSDDQQDERQVEVTLAEHPDQPGVAYLGVILGASFHKHPFRGPSGRFHMSPFFKGDEWPFDFNHPFDWMPKDFGLDELDSYDDSA
jgi:membrane-associated protease RseP (regulator of RpoE activity)